MSTDQLSATFAALADPTRRAILARLTLGETTVSELAKPFKMSGPAVSKHLKVLERAGSSRGAARRSGVPAASRPTRLKDVDAWLESYRALWDERLDRLEVYLREVQAKQKKGKRHGRHDR